MKKTAFIFIFLLLQIVKANAQYSGILMDGFFDDWPGSAKTFTDTKGDAKNIDIENISLWNDSINFYIRFKTDKEINIQESPINLYIDTDNNASTGSQFFGIGVDFAYFFGSRRGVFKDVTVFHDNVGHISLPTHTANEFEIAFNRNALPDLNNKLFSSGTIKLILREEVENGDVMPDNGAITYSFTNNPQPKYTAIEIAKEDTGFLRLMNYNILRDRPMETLYQDQFQRIIKAIKPDIIAFNEFYNSSATDIKQLIDNTLSTGNTNGWYAVKQGQDLITLSRFPIKQSWLVFPGHNISAVLIDLPSHFEKDILVINAHFRCCSSGSINRQMEADAIVDFLRDAKTVGGEIDLPENTPFILMGDLNLVTDKQQLTTILNGDIQDNTTFGEDIKPDWDTTDLEDLVSYHTDAPLSHTWYDASSDFAPGRLDYMIYSNSQMQVEKAFTLETAAMSPARLSKYNLDATDTRMSDHLPKVADFRLARKTTIGLNETSRFSQAHIYPNPFAEMLYINLPENASTAQIKIMDITGKVVFSANINNRLSALYTQKIKPGIYMLQLRTDQDIYIQKLIKR